MDILASLSANQAPANQDSVSAVSGYLQELKSQLSKQLQQVLQQTEVLKQGDQSNPATIGMLAKLQQMRALYESQLNVLDMASSAGITSSSSASNNAAAAVQVAASAGDGVGAPDDAGADDNAAELHAQSSQGSYDDGDSHSASNYYDDHYHHDDDHQARAPASGPVSPSGELLGGREHELVEDEREEDDDDGKQ